MVAVGGRRMAHHWPLTGGRQDTPGLAGVRMEPDGAVGTDPTRTIRLDGFTAQVYDLALGKPISPPLVHGAEIVMAAFSPDGRQVMTAARDRTVRVWDAVTGKPLTPPLRQGRAAHRAAFSGDGRRLLTTGEDGVLRVWDLASREVMQPLPPPTGSGPTAFSPDGRLIAATDRSGAVWVRDAVTAKPLRGPWRLARAVTGLAFSPDGRRVLAAAESSARIWDAVSGEAVTPDLSHTGPVQRVMFTPDGSRAVILGSGERLDVFDAATGALQPSHVAAGKLPAWGVVLTPDGRADVTMKARTVESVELRDIVSRELRAGPFRHAGRVTAVAVSPDGKRLAAATADGAAFLWDIATARPAAPPLQHGPPLHQLAFSADGRRLVTVADDHTARVWDVATGQPVTPLLSQGDAVASASLAPDGGRLVLRARSGAGAIWDLTPDARPLDDLVHLTQVLSGQVLDGQSGGLEPVEDSGLRDAWPRLRAKYPQEFTPSALPTVK